MRPNATVVAAMAAAVLATPVAPTQARTLDRRTALRLALEQNPQIAAARAEEAAVAAQQRQVNAARWPIVTLDAAVSPSLKATLAPGTAVQSVEDQYSGLKFGDLSAAFLGELAVIQPLYTFGKIAHRQEAAAHGLKAREAQTRMTRADVAFEVARLYESYLFARDAHRFLEETLHWLERTLESTQERLAQEAGNVTERDVLRLQTALGLARMGLHQADAGRAQTEAGLIAYLGLPAGETVVVAEAELAPVGHLPQLPALATLADRHRPELTAVSEGERAITALASAEAAGFAPDVFLMGFISAAYTPGRDWLQTRFVTDRLNHFIPGLLLGLRWQFQGAMAFARSDEQKARASGLQHTQRWARAGIPAEIRRHREDILRARRDIAAGTEAMAKAKQWMVQASADYSVGFLDGRDVSDAVSAYVTVRTAVMRARLDHNVAMAALARATGTLDGDSHLLYLAPADDPTSNEATR